jgi:hypothetical protein
VGLGRGSVRGVDAHSADFVLTCSSDGITGIVCEPIDEVFTEVKGHPYTTGFDTARQFDGGPT